MSYFGYAMHAHNVSPSNFDPMVMMAEDEVLQQEGFDIAPIDLTEAEALLPPVDPEVAVVREAASKGYVKCNIIAA